MLNIQVHMALLFLYQAWYEGLCYGCALSVPKYSTQPFSKVLYFLRELKLSYRFSHFAKSAKTSIPFSGLGDWLHNIWPLSLHVSSLSLGYFPHNFPSENFYKQCCYLFLWYVVKSMFISINVITLNPYFMHVNHLSYCLAQDKSSTNHSCDGYLLFLLSNTLFSPNSTALCPRRMTHGMSHCVLMLSGSRLDSLTRGDQREGVKLGWVIYFPGFSLKNCSKLAAPSMEGHGSCQVVHA